MKISKPTKFFPNVSDTATLAKLEAASKVVTRGDLLVKYAATDSINEADWSLEASDLDKWIKISFDCGLSYPIKMSLDNSLSYSEVVSASALSGETLYSIEFPNETVYNACRSNPLFATVTTGNGTLKSISNIEYSFDSSIVGDTTTYQSDIVLSSLNINDDDEGVKFSFMFTPDVTAIGIPTPSYWAYVTAIPMVYDSSYGYVNYLDSNYQSFSINSKLVNINKILLEIVSASSTISGNIKLQFTNTLTGASFTQIVPISKTKSWIEILPPSALSGEIRVTRLYSATEDTLKDTNNVVITTIINNIKTEQI